MARLLLIIFFILLPTAAGSGYPHSFTNWQDYARYWSIRQYHGSVAVCEDFTHFIDERGQICRNNGRW
jgi:hypothetical protein